MASKLLLLRQLSRRLLRPPSSSTASSTKTSRSPTTNTSANLSGSCVLKLGKSAGPISYLNSFHILEAKKSLHLFSNSHDGPRRWIASRSFCSSPLNFDDDTNIPTAIDYHSVLQEDEFHRLVDSTIQDLQEKFEEYGDSVRVDDFDIDYGVLTLKLGDRGTYVLHKQTPNRQIWLSSPVSGPQRFDWDRSAQAWVYRRTKARLLKILEGELEELYGEPISLS